MGTPIIPQPQVAILAIGAIVKKPAVLETKDGDVIAVRQKMFMSHSYDHRVVDGSLGGMFLKHVHDYLENWDLDTKFNFTSSLRGTKQSIYKLNLRKIFRRFFVTISAFTTRF
jgi:hypothetical protein